MSSPEPSSEASPDEFAAWMSRAHPDVARESALWRWHRHDFEHAAVTDLTSIRPPAEKWISSNWTRYSDVAAQTEFCSVPLSVRLDRHAGELHKGQKQLTHAFASVQLAQVAVETAPIVELLRHGMVDTDDVLPQPGSRYRLTLDEAAGLAHLLLLAVDVARAERSQ
ncbi:hypothetical protein JGU71_13985 [Antrihabitans sp. YC3-6]|uniref:Uncharacterized protein n=1 Tax=Antrihabitans stalagmiti TaxID=2799499 RepID=A0A934NRI0_9NOCA|nr:hypothetical protein [Antrihabitans stalagmiti]MBJ8340002.1 hypothetical protein [Antrihabitans stalagmiti]